MFRLYDKAALFFLKSRSPEKQSVPLANILAAPQKNFQNKPICLVSKDVRSIGCSPLLLYRSGRKNSRRGPFTKPSELRPAPNTSRFPGDYPFVRDPKHKFFKSHCQVIQITPRNFQYTSLFLLQSHVTDITNLFVRVNSRNFGSFPRNFFIIYISIYRFDCSESKYCNKSYVSYITQTLE